MAQNKEGTEKKPGVKIQDLSPKKDAKGGVARQPNSVGANSVGANSVGADSVGANKTDPNATNPNAGGGRYQD
jgi:hypothetical protein